MAIKRVITAVEFAKLSAPLQAEYKESGEGNYTLDLTDYEDTATLKRAKDHERDQAKEARKLLKEATEQLAALTEERDGLLKGAIPKADVEKLESSYKTKLASREKELTAQIESLTGNLQTMLVDNVATTLAAKISTVPAVIMPHIKARLKAERTDDGKYITRVLDSEGKPSAASVADLEKEFSVNPDFKAIITGSKASGGGAGGSQSGGGAGAGKINWSGSPKEIAASLAASGKIKAE